MKRKGIFLIGGAIGAMTAAERRQGRYMRGPDGHGDGGGGGGGGASGLLDEDPAPGEGGTPAPSPSPAPAPAAGADDPAAMAWASGISAEKADGEELSDREWLAKRGYKDFTKVVADARGLERSLRESGKVKIPGADAKPEEIKAFREAIGVPESPAGYEIKLPDVGDGEFKLELDTKFLEPMRSIAHEGNIPAPVFQKLAEQFVQMQLEDMKAEVLRADTERDQVLRDWADKAPQMRQDFRRGAEVLGLKKADIAMLQRGEGNTPILMAALAKVGALAGEDFFSGEGGSQKFGVASEEEAQTELDRMNSDPDTYAKLRAKDPATVAKRDRLLGAVASFRAQKAGKQGR